MSTPIACTLTGDDYVERRQRLARLADDALIDRQPLQDGVRLRFTATAATADELRAIVAAEAECCPFLRLDLDERDELLELDVTGPADARPIIVELFA